MSQLRTEFSKIRIYTTAAVCTASFISFIEIFPHSILLDKYKEIIARYKRGVEVPLHDDVRHLFNKVLDDLNIKEKYKKYFNPFTITGFDTYYAGIWKCKYNVIIGIPGHFIWKNKNAVDILDIRVGVDKEPLNPYDPITDNLVESFVLSDKAKKFAIAREVLMSQKNLPIYRSLESPSIVSTTALIADVIGRQYRIFEKPFPIVVLFCTGLGLMSFATWFQLRDSLNRFFERRVDKQLSELGPDYIEGGKEFYDKLLKRNKAMRKLLGKRGRSQYNSHGDEIFLIRQKRTPITERKKFFENCKITELPKGEVLAA